MSEPKPGLRLVTTNELAALYPTILPRSTLDFYAQHSPCAIPFSQPFGKGGRRVYNLDVVEQILAGGFQPEYTPAQGTTETTTKINSPRSRPGRTGTGLAAFTPKKRGPKPRSSSVGEGN